jgi:hypothetical protein
LRRHLRKAHPALNQSLNEREAAKAQTAELKASSKLLKLQAKEAKKDQARKAKKAQARKAEKA